MKAFFNKCINITLTIASLTIFSVTSWSQADIVDLKDLITDANEAVWTDIDGNELVIDNNAGLNQVSRGAKLGGIHGSSFSRSGRLDIDKTLSKETVDIRLSPTLNNRASAIKGTYSLDLPDMKRIQLEIRHDAFLDSQSNPSSIQFYVEVFTKDTQGDYIRDAVLDTGIDPVEERGGRVFQIEKNETETESFTSNPAIVDLTEWAGQSIKLSLVSYLPLGAATTNSGRWVNARLVGATFNFSFDRVVNTNTIDFQGKFHNPNSSSRNVLSSTIQNIGATETINIFGIDSYNEGPMPTVTVGSASFAYLVASTTTYVFDLSDNPGSTMYNVDKSDLEDALVRTGSPPAPGPSGTPYIVLSQPVPHDFSSWYNHYAGINGAVVEVDGSDEIVHAFFHAEDNSLDGLDYNSGSPPWKYTRIGYARSNTNSALNFTVTGYSGGEIIIESPQAENQVDGSFPEVGVGSPAIVEEGSYYYCFYNRRIDSTLPATIPSGIKGGHYICVARVLKSDIHSSNYSSNSNPWKKYYNGTWNEGGLGGKDTEIIDENWRVNPSVEYYHEWSEHIMICTGPDGFYIYTQIYGAGMQSWDQGMLFMPKAENRQYIYPALIGNRGDSDYSYNYDHMLYFGYDEDTEGGGHTLVRRYLRLDH